MDDGDTKGESAHDAAELDVDYSVGIMRTQRAASRRHFRFTADRIMLQ